MEGKEPLSGPVLAAAVDGNEPALWLFNPESSDRVKVSTVTDGEVPVSMDFSEDFSRWYGVWRAGTLSQLHAFDPRSGEIFWQMPTNEPFVTVAPGSDLVVNYGREKFFFFDAGDLSLVGERRIDEVTWDLAAASGRPHLYYERGNTIQIFDTEQMAPVDSVVLFGPEDPRYGRTSAWRLELGPNDHHLYVTTFTAQGLDGFGTFYMIDLMAREVVFEGRAGKYSQMALSPDGRFVYIDGPGGINRRRNFASIGELLRFDVQQRKMEVFIKSSDIDGSDEAKGLQINSRLQTDQITMLDGSAFVVNLWGVLDNDTEPRRYPILVKMDTETGEVLATHDPRDNRSATDESVRKLRLGFIP